MECKHLRSRNNEEGVCTHENNYLEVCGCPCVEEFIGEKICMNNHNCSSCKDYSNKGCPFSKMLSRLESQGYNGLEFEEIKGLLMDGIKKMIRS